MPVEAGNVIAHVASVSPGRLAKPQVHVEVFSVAPLFVEAPWTIVDGTAGGRFCDAPEIDAVIDGDGDGRLDRDELAASTPRPGAGGRQLRYVIARHVSVWTPRPSWRDALRVPADFRCWPAAELDQLVADQIAPTLWWDRDTAAHCRLPADGVVYHYHPISFVSWVDHLQRVAAAAASPVVDASDAAASGEHHRRSRAGRSLRRGRHAGRPRERLRRGSVPNRTNVRRRCARW